MADWTFETTDALTAETFARDWWIEAKQESYFDKKGFIGSNQADDIIVEFADLMKEQGYQHSFGQVRNLTGAGVSGDNTMEGNEEAPDIYDDAITLGQKRNAVRTKGKLSDQYPSDKKLRQHMKELLGRWMADTVDQDIFTALGTSLTKAIYGGDATSTSDIEAGDYFTLAFISKCVAYAEKATPKIIGKNMDGDKCFAVVISPDQAFDLTRRDSEWSQSRREALPRGEDNPLFKGPLGYHDNTVIHKHSRVATATTWGSGTNLNGATALFMGVQAGGIAYAMKKSWNEKTFDYGNKAGICVGAIYGVTKAVFNSSDNAVVGIRTYRTSN